MEMYFEIKQQMAEICLSVFREGLFTGTSGNLSCRLPQKDQMLITPSGLRYEGMRAEDIMHVDFDGRILLGKHAPSSEWRMHAVIYERFPEVNAVFHTHSPYATAFATLRRNIPSILVETELFLGGEIPCAAFAAPGTREVGESAAAVLPGKGGCLLGSHGVLAVGKDLPEARPPDGVHRGGREDLRFGPRRWERRL